MTKCKECGERLLSDELEKCRECILEEHDELIEDLVSSIESNRLRELTVVHSEVRKRINK